MTRHWPRLLCLTAVLSGCLAGTARPQGSQFTAAQRADIVRILREALVSDPSILREALTALQTDDNTRRDTQAAAVIRQLSPQLFHDAADPVAGNPSGSVTLVEFYDLRCPYCRSMAPAMDQLIAQDHDLRVVYKDLPILGPQSVLGAKALLAAQKQGGYLKLQAQLLAASEPITEALLQRFAAADGLDWGPMKAAMNEPEIAARIGENLALAHALGVQGTPAIVVDDRLVPGAMDLAGLRQLVQANK